MITNTQYSIIVLVLIAISCKNEQKPIKNPVPNTPSIKFNSESINNSIWHGTNPSNGHLIYLDIGYNSKHLSLLEIDTSKHQYIESVSDLYLSLKDSICLLSNFYSGKDSSYYAPLITSCYVGNEFYDSLLRKNRRSELPELMEYKSITQSYSMLHFKNRMIGKLNLSTLDEIEFRNVENEIIFKVKRDSVALKEEEFTEPFTYKYRDSTRMIDVPVETDSSTIVYSFITSGYPPVTTHFFRETLNGQKVVKWNGYFFATYMEDLMVLRYVFKDSTNYPYPEFVKISPLHPSLAKLPFNGSY